MRNRLFAPVLMAACFILVFYTISAAEILSAGVVGPFPKVGEYEVLRGDFHMHTVNSDGRLTARERINEARERGLDVFAITDHGNFRAARFEINYAQTLGMVALRGMETGLPGGTKYHLVALGFDPLYKPVDPHRWSETPGGKTAYYRDEMIKLQKAGAFVLLAHPQAVSFIEPIMWGIEHKIIQGVELHNSRTYIPLGFDTALKYDLSTFADSDAHGAAAKNYTLVFSKQKNAKSVIEAFRAHRTVTLYDGTFWGTNDMLSMLINGLIKARWVNENGAGYVVFENNGPVSMKGTTGGVSGQVIEIPSKSQVRIPRSGGGTISITWDNAFISSSEKLTTTYKINN